MQPLSVYIGGNYQLLPMFSNFFHKFLRKQERPGGRSYHTILCNFSQEGQRRNGVSQEVLCQAFFQESVRATPVLRAASATAAATAGTTRGSKGLGMMFSSDSSSSGMTAARAMAAAIFISSLMSLARTSSAPRKMPGKASTLLIWLG